MRYAVMVLLSGTLEQRLIGGILNEGMLEQIGRLGWYPLLVDQIGVY